MQLAKTVTGVYVLDEGVVASAAFAADDLPGVLFAEHPLEEEYPEAAETALPIERIAELADVPVQDVRQRLRDASIAYTREEISASTGRDQLLVQAVRALDDINEVNNELSERLRPWEGLHAPGVEEAEEDNEAFARLVADHAQRAEMGDAAGGTGMDITSRDAAMLERFAAHLSDGYALREELEDYVESLAGAVVPNLATVCEPLLAARLLSEAGSLEKLAKMPSSTVQVLGAEKAMFRHMKGEGSAPKHGVLFMHPRVQQAPGDSRGKMARVVANKASIAARIDQYGGDFRGDTLRDEVEETFSSVTAE